MTDESSAAVPAQPVTTPPARSRGGRPTRLDQARADSIVECLRKGGWRSTCARAAGVAPSSLFNWIKRGKAARSGAFLEFLHRVEAAEAEAEMRNVAVIDTAAQAGDWRAAAFQLERRHPHRWGRRGEMTVKGGTTHASRLDVTVTALAGLPDDVRALLRAGAANQSDQSWHDWYQRILDAVGPKRFAAIVGRRPEEVLPHLLRAGDGAP